MSGQPFPPIKPQPAEKMAPQIGRLATHQWGHEFPAVIALPAFRPRYEVPGRRHNGSVAGQHRIRWLLGRILLPLWAIVASVVGLLINADVFGAFRTARVRGPAGCRALGFADANRGDQQSLIPDELWLLTSRERAVLCVLRKQISDPRLDVLWSAEGAALPLIDSYRETITWPDGSVVEYGSRKKDR